MGIFRSMSLTVSKKEIHSVQNLLSHCGFFKFFLTTELLYHFCIVKKCTIIKQFSNKGVAKFRKGMEGTVSLKRLRITVLVISSQSRHKNTMCSMGHHGLWKGRLMLEAGKDLTTLNKLHFCFMQLVRVCGHACMHTPLLKFIQQIREFA